MDSMKQLRFLKRLNDHYNRGMQHGLKGKNRPGYITGQFKRAYKSGQSQGSRLRQLKDFKR